MAVPTAITDLSATAASNSPAGSDAVFTDLDNFLRAIQAFIRQGDTRAANVASASTADLGAAVGRIVNITGTTTITSFGTVAAGIWRVVTFAGALTLTHNATSLILPGGASITTAAGDSLIAESLGSGNWKVHVFMPAAGYVNKAGDTISNLMTYNGGSAWTSANWYRTNKLKEQRALQFGETSSTYVFGAGASIGQFYVFSNTAEDTSVAPTYRLQITGSTGLTYLSGVYDNTSAGAANVYVTTGGAMYRSTSSLRYKTDVRSYGNALQDALNLRPVTYASKSQSDAGRRFLGFIAEEVDSAGIKEAVVYDEQGRPDALHYGQMVAIAIGAIQAQQQQIEALKAQIAALK